MLSLQCSFIDFKISNIIAAIAIPNHNFETVFKSSACIKIDLSLSLEFFYSNAIGWKTLQKVISPVHNFKLQSASPIAAEMLFLSQCCCYNILATLQCDFQSCVQPDCDQIMNHIRGFQPFWFKSSHY